MITDYAKFVKSFADFCIIKKIRAGFALTILLIPLFPGLCQASPPPKVVVSELAWMGAKINDIEQKNWWRYEWFEFYNNNSEIISLDGWRMELYRPELELTIVLTGKINPGEYFVAVSSDRIFNVFDQNYSNLAGKFYNKGGLVLLKDSSGETIDAIDCSLGWFAGNNGTKQTMERINLAGNGNDKNNWANSDYPNGTPGGKREAKNNYQESTIAGTSTKQKTEEQKIQNYAPGIIINEILPSPAGPDEENEWIEIYNNGNFAADLSGWQVCDTTGNTVFYKFPQGSELNAKKYLVIKRPQTKIILNNEKDGLNLILPDGKVLQAISYEKAPQNQSYCKIGDNWSWNKNLTPGAENAPLQDIQKTQAPEGTANGGNVIQESNESQDRAKDYLAYAGQKTDKNKNYIIISSAALLLAAASGICILALKKVATK